MGGARARWIQAQPSRSTNEPGPYVLSGMNGAVAGASFGYRLGSRISLFVTPELNLMFPRVLLDVDLTAGVELGLF